MTGCPLLDSEYASRQNGKRFPCERMSEEIERLRTQVNQLEEQCYGMDGMSASAKIRTLQRMNVLLREENGRLQKKRHEEIVRCRDCKHMHRVRSWLGMDVDECWLHADRESGELGKVDTEPDGFCAWGERRDA